MSKRDHEKDLLTIVKTELKIVIVIIITTLFCND